MVKVCTQLYFWVENKQTKQMNGKKSNSEYIHGEQRQQQGKKDMIKKSREPKQRIMTTLARKKANKNYEQIILYTLQVDDRISLFSCCLFFLFCYLPFCSFAQIVLSSTSTSSTYQHQGTTRNTHVCTTTVEAFARFICQIENKARKKTMRTTVKRNETNKSFACVRPDVAVFSVYTLHIYSYTKHNIRFLISTVWASFFAVTKNK